MENNCRPVKGQTIPDRNRQSNNLQALELALASFQCSSKLPRALFGPLSSIPGGVVGLEAWNGTFQNLKFAIFLELTR